MTEIPEIINFEAIRLTYLSVKPGVLQTVNDFNGNYPNGQASYFQGENLAYPALTVNRQSAVSENE